MLKWLKTKLRNWILEEEEGPEDHRFLEILEDGKVIRVRVLTSMGMYLRVMPLDGRGERIITSIQCVDPRKFDKAWEFLHKDSKLEWED